MIQFKKLAFSGALLYLLGTASLAAAQEHNQPSAEHEATSEHSPSEGHGGGEHHAVFDSKRFAFQIINFAVLVGILGFFSGKAINGALAARHDQMQKDLEEAATARTTAEARLKEQEKRLGNLEREVAALKAGIKDEAEKVSALLVKAAEEKARRVVDESRFLMDQQVKEAERVFREEVAQAALRIATDIVRRQVRPDDEARLNQTFVAELERGAAPAAATQREVRI